MYTYYSENVVVNATYTSYTKQASRLKTQLEHKITVPKQAQKVENGEQPTKKLVPAI